MRVFWGYVGLRGESRVWLCWRSLLLVVLLWSGFCLPACVTSQPCEGDGIGPLSFNPQGYPCQSRCECNNQLYHGVCRNGRCEVLAQRVACPTRKQSLEVHRSNVLLDEMCPDLLPDALNRCTTGTFTKVCGGNGLSTPMWSDCRCAGSVCQPGQQICDKDCAPSQPCSCFDLQTDSRHCGTCGHRCENGNICIKGSCQCSAPKVLCPAASCTAGVSCPKVCVDLQRDARHCGVCGTACEEGTLCAQGRCQEILLQPGSYTRGSAYNEVDWDNYHRLYNIPKEQETSHLVSLTRPFYLGRLEVTQGWFSDVMGYTPKSTLPCADNPKDCPVHGVTLYQAMDFCNQLSQQAKLELCYQCEKSGTSDVRCKAADMFSGRQIYQCRGYRLPTDAEWEFAARAGQLHPFPGGTPTLPIQSEQAYSSMLAPFAWYRDNAQGQLHAVGRKQANRFGLFDMRGHVAEWVWYSASSFTTVSRIDPAPDSETVAVVRGGSVQHGPLMLRAGARLLVSPLGKPTPPETSVPVVGFRIARTAEHHTLCPKSGLSACGIAGCINTLTDKQHCGLCERACSSFLQCQGGRCIRPEVLIPTKDGQGNPKTWKMGFGVPFLAFPICYRHDTPEHDVRFSYDFYAWAYEVQQQEFSEMMGFNPSYEPCPTCPVESVTWFQALAFANKMSQHFGLEPCYQCQGDPKDTKSLVCSLRQKFRGNQGKDYYKCPGYRLPTEAEWEYMATEADQKLSLCHMLKLLETSRQWHRATDTYNDLVYDLKSSRPRIAPVGLARPNTLGLFEMYSNVREWVWDVYHENYGSRKTFTQPVTDPIGWPDFASSLCFQCPPSRSRYDLLCLPCYRVIHGGYRYDYGLDEVKRYVQHVTKLRSRDETIDGIHIAPRWIGFRVVRTHLVSPAREEDKP